MPPSPRCRPLLAALALAACSGDPETKDGRELPPADTAPDGDTAPDTDADTDTDTDADTDTDSDTDTDTDTDTDSDTDSDTDADPCGDPGVIPTFTADDPNPVLLPVATDSDQGSDNIYAPDVVRVADDLCLLFYGGQGGDGHDRIFLATSTDCAHWHPWPSVGDPRPIVDNGTANHANDPSVVRVGDTWFMYYTVAATAEDDRIHLATSTNGWEWTPQGLVLDVGASGTWDDGKVGRPSVQWIKGTFRLYYDGNDGTARHVGLATSTDGRTFTRDPANPLYLNAGAVDVKRVSDTWLMLMEGGDGTWAATSADGESWCSARRIFDLTGESWDRYGQVTPFGYSRDGSSFDALLFGGASDACWCRNRIAEVWPDGVDAPDDPSAGCEACLVAPAADCADACRDGGYGVEGFCAAPGSTDPGACCACVDWG